MAGIHLTTQEKLRIRHLRIIIFYIHYKLRIRQFIVSLSAPALTHCLSTTFIEGGGRGGAGTPTVQLNSIFSAKTDPRENPEKNPDYNFFIVACEK
jgi:hypothetical protein